MRDFYEVLQVHPAAEPEVVRAAYHRLAEKYHPDRNPADGAAKRMAEINAAWKILSDADSRAWYDSQRGNSERPAETKPPSSRAAAPASPPVAPPPRATPAGEGWCSCGGAIGEIPNPAGCGGLIGATFSTFVIAIRCGTKEMKDEAGVVVVVAGIAWLIAMAHLVRRKRRVCQLCKKEHGETLF